MAHPRQNQRRGASGLTYGILVGLVSVVAITAIVNSGAGVNRLFGRVSDELRGVRLPTPVPTPAEPPLYAFTSFSFDTCGATGPNGPASTATCTGRSPYNAAGWTASTSNFQVSGGIQQWTVPATGTYRIEAAGAAGGGNGSYSGGRGAVIRAEFVLSKGAVLQILVGQSGLQGPSNCDAGSGGGSFVVAAGSVPLIVAGGGSGATYNINGQDGVYAEAGGSTICTTAGGAGGNGGPRGRAVVRSDGVTSTAGGGGGFLSNGQGGASWASSFGYGFAQGGGGSVTSSQAGSEGGFGGGGGGHGSCFIGSGGGGGYSGGAGGSNANFSTCIPDSTAALSGGGGGSFSAATAANRSNVGYNSGAGYVTITRL